jgi:hypothetical protein
MEMIEVNGSKFLLLEERLVNRQMVLAVLVDRQVIIRTPFGALR